MCIPSTYSVERGKGEWRRAGKKGERESWERTGNGRYGKKGRQERQRKGRNREVDRRTEKRRENKDMERGMGRKKGKRTEGKDTQRGETCRQITENCNFFHIFQLWGLLYQHPSRSGPNLACKCGQMVYLSTPNFIVMSIHYYT